MPIPNLFSCSDLLIRINLRSSPEKEKEKEKEKEEETKTLLKEFNVFLLDRLTSKLKRHNFLKEEEPVFFEWRAPIMISGPDGKSTNKYPLLLTHWKGSKTIKPISELFDGPRIYDPLSRSYKSDSDKLYGISVMVSLADYVEQRGYIVSRYYNEISGNLLTVRKSIFVRHLDFDRYFPIEQKHSFYVKDIKNPNIIRGTNSINVTGYIPARMTSFLRSLPQHSYLVGVGYEQYIFQIGVTGKVAHGETIDDGFRRELSEELCLKPKSDIKGGQSISIYSYYSVNIRNTEIVKPEYKEIDDDKGNRVFIGVFGSREDIMCYMSKVKLDSEIGDNITSLWCTQVCNLVNIAKTMTQNETAIPIAKKTGIKIYEVKDKGYDLDISICKSVLISNVDKSISIPVVYKT